MTVHFTLSYSDPINDPRFDQRAYTASFFQGFTHIFNGNPGTYYDVLLTDNFGNYIELRGTDLVADPTTGAITGTIGYLEIGRNGYVALPTLRDIDVMISSLNLSATDFVNAINSGNTDTIWSLLENGDDMVNGTIHNDHFGVTGDNAGNDVIKGLWGYDELWGGLGNDTLIGGSEGDWLVGGAGNDILDGTPGGPPAVPYDPPDTDDYDAAGYTDDGGLQGVFVNLSNVTQGTQAAGTATDSFGDQDTLIDIEEVWGTSFVDTIYAPDLSNQNDLSTAVGLGGADVIVGSSARDQVRYDWDEAYGGLAAGILVNFTTEDIFDGIRNVTANSVLDGFGEIDSVTNVEQVRATLYVDQMYGGFANETFLGLKGNDIIDGGDGFDVAGYWNDERYTGGTSGVIANLSSGSKTVGTKIVAGGTVIDGFGTVDTVINIEAIDGTKFNDIMYAGNSGNDFYSGAGNDTLVGGTGDDYPMAAPALMP